MTENLIDGLFNEMDRVREIIKEYEAIPAGFIAASLMKIDIQNAENSIKEGDTIKMMLCYSKLKEYEL